MSAVQLAFDIFARDNASRTINNVGGAVQNNTGKWDKWKTAAVGAAVAVGAGLVKFGSDSVDAYKESQQSAMQLQQALDKFPATADTNIAKLGELNSALSQKTKYDDDATASGQAVLAGFGLTGAQLEQITPLLQDYASKTGTDLPTAAQALGKAVNGQGRALKGIGLNLKDAGSESANFAAVMGGLNSKVGGFAENEGKSAAGQAEILKNQYGELQETVGGLLTPALQKLQEKGIEVVNWISDNQTKAIALGATVGGLVVAVWAVQAAVAAWSAITAASTAVGAAWGFMFGANNVLVRLSTSYLGTWVGVKAIELGSWISTTAGTVGHTIALGANKVAAGVGYLLTFVAVKGLELAAWISSTASTVAATAGLAAYAVASGAVRVATMAWTGVQWLLNAALTANPIGLVVAAIALLIGGVILAYNKVGWFRDGVNLAWTLIKTGAVLAIGYVKDFIRDRINDIVGMAAKIIAFKNTVVQGFTNLKTEAIEKAVELVTWFTGLPGRISSAVSGMWDGLSSGFRTVVNSIIGAWNNFHLTIGGGSVLGVSIPSVTLNTPDIPYLWQGGTAMGAGGLAVVGDRGPELLSLPGGASVLPLDDKTRSAALGGGMGGPAVHIENFHAGGQSPGEIAAAFSFMARYA